MEPDEIVQEAIKKMNKRVTARITDEIFLIIQNDRKLMQEYLRSVHRQASKNSKDYGHDTVNQMIGKAVKKQYGLEDCGKESNPSSTLIRSYTKLK